ncbi:hypothetical protein ABIC08_009239 [Bradyrhizobium sp. RT9b]|uniref:hypothetical protein n=1 Tax=Bradyrhizobium sp. RT9b TaxID=3156385 RepID=UPI0033958A25
METKFKRITVLPPIRRQTRYPALDMTVIHASGRDTQRAENQSWKLITDLPVRGRSEAIEAINWYAPRWKNRGVSQTPEIRLQG